jgi:hypothetical protein
MFREAESGATRSGCHDSESAYPTQDIPSMLTILDPRGQSFNQAHAARDWSTLPQSCGYVAFQQVQVLSVVSPQDMAPAVGGQPKRHAEIGIIRPAELRRNPVPAVGRPGHCPAIYEAARQASQPARHPRVQSAVFRLRLGTDVRPGIATRTMNENLTRKPP